MTFNTFTKKNKYSQNGRIAQTSIGGKYLHEIPNLRIALVQYSFAIRSLQYRTWPCKCSFAKLVAIIHVSLRLYLLSLCLLFLYVRKLQKRLQKELMSLIKEPPAGVTVDADLAEQNLLL